jgi:integrase
LPRAFKVTQKLPQYVSLDFFENQIVKDLPEIFTSIDIKKVETILYFMFFSGLRKSEILMLKKEHFNFKEAECKVYIPKRKEERLIPLTERIMKMIISYSYDNPSDINIFGITNKQLTYICKKIADNYKIKFSCHTFRHSFAMHMLSKGFSVIEVQFLLGHKNMASTTRYIRADINQIKTKFKKLI